MINTVGKQIIPFENNGNLLDASFSSYLNDSQDAFIRKQAHNLLVPTSPHSTYMKKKNVEDGEIGIFGAEKYFTGAIDQDISVISNKDNNNPTATRQKDKEEVVLDALAVKHKAQSGTPSVRSEASWNSRSALLQSNPRNTQSKEMNKVRNVKSFFALLGCNCNGEDSVEINENNCQGKVVLSREITVKPIKANDFVVQTTKSLSLSSRWADEEIQNKKLDSNSKREDCFSFPVVNQVVKQENGAIKNTLEVFGSPIMERSKKSFSLERKLTRLNWDGVTPKGYDIEIQANKNDTCNDSESDASSDLFEIESFSTNCNSFPGRHTSDGVSKVTSNGYAPSEASIDWSIATASVADVSVISAYQEIRNGTAKNNSAITWNMKNNNEGKEVVQKKVPNILSGCTSLKSVRVAGDEYRTMSTERAEIGSPRGRLRLDSSTPITKFQAEAKLTGFDPRSRVQNGIGARPLPRSHSPHTSHLLYIQ